MRKKNKNTAHVYSFEKKDKNYYNLIIKKLFIKKLNDIIKTNLLFYSMYILKVPNNTVLSFFNLCTLVKSRSLLIFKLAISIDFLRNHKNLKKTAIKNEFLFAQLFSSKKLAKLIYWIITCQCK